MAANNDPKKARVLPFPKKGIALSAPKVSNLDINASSVPRPAALGEDELHVQLPRIVCYGNVRESWHAKTERAYRNVSIDDIQHMLRSEWKLVGKPQWNVEHRDWAYKLTGSDLDDDELTLVLSVNVEEQTLFVITKY